MQYSEIIAMAYEGNGPRKLAKAEKLFEEYGKELQEQAEINDALFSLREAVTALETHMTGMHMGDYCSVCAATPNGGCCSAYMGHENNDVLQLLMNMLAGVAVNCARDDDVECCFLAEKGCLLLFKPIFCLNYLCQRIQIGSTVDELQELEKRTGELLGRQVAFEQLLIAALTNKSKKK